MADDNPVTISRQSLADATAIASSKVASKQHSPANSTTKGEFLELAAGKKSGPNSRHGSKKNLNIVETAAASIPGQVQIDHEFPAHVPADKDEFQVVADVVATEIGSRPVSKAASNAALVTSKAGSKMNSATSKAASVVNVATTIDNKNASKPASRIGSNFNLINSASPPKSSKPASKATSAHSSLHEINGKKNHEPSPLSHVFAEGGEEENSKPRSISDTQISKSAVEKLASQAQISPSIAGSNIGSAAKNRDLLPSSHEAANGDVDENSKSRPISQAGSISGSKTGSAAKNHNILPSSHEAGEEKSKSRPISQVGSAAKINESLQPSAQPTSETKVSKQVSHAQIASKPGSKTDSANTNHEKTSSERNNEIDETQEVSLQTITKSLSKPSSTQVSKRASHSNSANHELLSHLETVNLSKPVSRKTSKPASRQSRTSLRTTEPLSSPKTLQGQQTENSATGSRASLHNSHQDLASAKLVDKNQENNPPAPLLIDDLPIENRNTEKDHSKNNDGDEKATEQEDMEVEYAEEFSISDSFGCNSSGAKKAATESEEFRGQHQKSEEKKEEQEESGKNLKLLRLDEISADVKSTDFDFDEKSAVADIFEREAVVHNETDETRRKISAQARKKMVENDDDNAENSDDYFILICNLRQEIILLKKEIGIRDNKIEGLKEKELKWMEAFEKSPEKGSDFYRKNTRILLDRQKKAYQILVAKLRQEIRRLKFQRNSISDPLIEAKYFPYLPRTPFSTASHQPQFGTIGNLPPRSSDYFALNPPPPTGNHLDNGNRWWWGSGQNITTSHGPAQN
ncbi:hypothetical protein HK100_008201 [Physocladia obscura]|uniref:Uncharacterized protein n=1 Tax=Physocladia obscura TaxID=109957 RepID=A0AAD5SQL4_9FUNG|nr:hypothetical protein HK100_008201 [Physocladia obscura]